MRLSSRSKLSILLSVVTFVAVIGAIVLTAVPRGPTIHAAGGSGPTAIKGTATKVGSSSLSTSSQSTQAAPANPYKFELPYRLDSSSLIPKGTASSVPSGQGVSLSDPPAGALLQNFNGVSSLDSVVANVINGSSFAIEPPDQGLCVGPSSFYGQEIVIEPVNDAYNIYATNGTPLNKGTPPTTGPLSLSSLFKEPPFVFTSPSTTTGVFLSDPRCVFDPATGDFFFTVTAFPLTLPAIPTSSRIDVTVLHQSGVFNTFRFDTTDLGGPGCPCVGDQPKLGIDQNNIYISADEFSFASGNFNGSNVFAISKSQLDQNAALVHFAEFLHLTDAGLPVPALQPAISTGNPPPPVEYLVHSFVLSSSSDRLGVFAIANGQVVSSGGMPTLLGPVVAQSEGYSQPQAAPSTGGVTLQADDDRLQQVQFINGRLWAALSTGFFVNNNPQDGFCIGSVCDAAAWFQIAPVLIQNHLIGAVVTQQGYVAVNGVSVLYPAIVQSPNGNVDMAFSVTSPTLNPSAAFAVNVNQSFLGQGHVFIAATGADPDKGFTCSPCRWGDYSWATLDPSSNNIWMGSEYIVPQADAVLVNGQTITNWGTRIYEVAA